MTEDVLCSSVGPIAGFLKLWS